MSQVSRQLRFKSAPAGRCSAPRRAVLLLAFVQLGVGCARFGFDRLDLDPDLGAPGSLTNGVGGRDGVGGGGSGAGGASGAGGGGDVGGGSSGEIRVDAGGPARADAGFGGAPDGNCSDGARNGDEDGVDCGGSRCVPCVCSLGAPVRLADPNYAGNNLWSPTLSSDGLRLYFGVTIPALSEQVAVATRTDTESSFGLGQPLAAPINLGKEGTPYLTLDGLSLYFYSERAGGAGSRDLYVATRQSGAGSFDDVTPLSSLNTSGLDYHPWLSPDELTIHFASGSAGSCDIFRATRASVGVAFDAPVAVTELNTSSDEGGITLSADGREAILASNRPGGPGARDLFRFTRAGTNDPFSNPEPIGELNTPSNEIDPAFSPDGSELYFASNRDGNDSALYRSVRRCAP
jgi:hypothetical protein